MWVTKEDYLESVKNANLLVAALASIIDWQKVISAQVDATRKSQQGLETNVAQRLKGLEELLGLKQWEEGYMAGQSSATFTCTKCEKARKPARVPKAKPGKRKVRRAA